MPPSMQSNRRFFLAIRHRPTGGFLPAQQAYGFTRCDPSLEEPPRLFTKRGPCKQALDRWLQGAWYEKLDGDGETTIDVIVKPNRRAADMEIVEIEVIVRSLTEAQLRIL